MSTHLIATIACADRRGLVAAVASFFADHGCNIIESAHFTDPATNRFFMRVVVDLLAAPSRDELERAFAEVADALALTWRFHDPDSRPNVVILASKHAHCLNDLLFRVRHSGLGMSVAAVISNHRDMEPMVRAYGMPFHHLPVSTANREAQERDILSIVEATGAELVVLARYMQVLSPTLTAALAGRCINIHHSFLPSFKGARPYHQAYARGVKLIGATAHFVTTELDEGPIIEQDTIRVDHAYTPDALSAAGRDVESQVLYRAVRAFLERRVFVDGIKTVVLR